MHVIEICSILKGNKYKNYLCKTNIKIQVCVLTVINLTLKAVECSAMIVLDWDGGANLPNAQSGKKLSVLMGLPKNILLCEISYLLMQNSCRTFDWVTASDLSKSTEVLTDTRVRQRDWCTRAVVAPSIINRKTIMCQCVFFSMWIVIERLI